MTKTLAELSREFSVAFAKIAQEKVISIRDQFSVQIGEMKENSNGNITSLWPQRSQLLLLKLFAEVFPTTDYRHPVVTPIVLFLSQLLVHCPITNLKDVKIALFTSNLLFFVSFTNGLKL